MADAKRTTTVRTEREGLGLRPESVRHLPLLGSCGCGSGCSCGCQSGSACQCGGGCG